MALTCIQKEQLLAGAVAFLNKVQDVTKATDDESKIYTDGQIVDAAVGLSLYVMTIINREAQIPKNDTQKTIMDAYYDMLLDGADSEIANFVREIRKKYTYEQPQIELKEEFILQPRVASTNSLAALKSTDIVRGVFQGRLE